MEESGASAKGGRLTLAQARLTFAVTGKMMIGLLLAGALGVQSATTQASGPPSRKAGHWCRGIHMPSATGGANLIATTIRGPTDNLKVISDQMKIIGAFVSFKEGQGAASELKASYRDDLDIKEIGRLLNRIDTGEFGPLKTEDFMMPLETLPADKCIRFQRPKQSSPKPR